MKQQLGDRLQFIRAFAANPRAVGAVLPTSRWAVRDMLDLGDVAGAELIVEMGAGTGVQTGELLARMGPDARLISFEIDARLAKLLQARYADPRLQVVNESAEHVDSYLGGRKPDVVVSALPYTSLEPDLRRRLLDLLPRVVSPTGTVLMIQYSPVLQGELRRRFGTLKRRISPRNVPPAFLFAGTEPRQP